MARITRDPLRGLFLVCDYRTDEGITVANGYPQHVRRSYRSNGNWDLHVDGAYAGTYWTG